MYRTAVCECFLRIRDIFWSSVSWKQLFRKMVPVHESVWPRRRENLPGSLPRFQLYQQWVHLEQNCRKIFENPPLRFCFVLGTRRVLKRTADPSPSTLKRNVRGKRNRICCIAGCRVKAKDALLQFPSRARRKQLELWRESLHMDPSDTVTGLRICRQHFREDDFQTGKQDWYARISQNKLLPTPPVRFRDNLFLLDQMFLSILSRAHTVKPVNAECWPCWGWSVYFPIGLGISRNEASKTFLGMHYFCAFYTILFSAKRPCWDKACFSSSMSTSTVINWELSWALGPGSTENRTRHHQHGNADYSRLNNFGYMCPTWYSNAE